MVNLAFPEVPEISWKFTGKPYDLNSMLTPDGVWEALDKGPEEVRQALVTVTNTLNSTVSGSSGAENIGSPTIAGIMGNTVYTQIANLLAIAQAAQAGTIIPGTVTDVMLSDDPAQIKGVVAAHLAESVTHTKANITYYVRPDGNDANDGSANDASHAFRTIQHAIDLLPRFVNHTVVINVASGTYDEDVIVQGFIGAGLIMVNAGTSPVDSDNYPINTLLIKNNFCGITIRGFSIASTSTSSFALSIYHSGPVNVSHFKNITVVPGGHGAYIQWSSVQIYNGEFSNKSNGITAEYNSKVFSNSCSGSGNGTGLYASENATIGKHGTQPTGTTAELIQTGGEIR